MTEPMTEIVAGPGSIMERGHVERREAVARARRYWERQADKAQRALAALDAGEERVSTALAALVIIAIAAALGALT